MAEIVIDDLTTKDIDGSGVFDELMSTMATRLDDQYCKTRIKGTDYSKVYLGGMEAAMAQSIAFLLGRQKADKEAEAIGAGIAKTEAETSLIAVEKLKAQEELCILEEQCLQEKTKSSILVQDLAKVTKEVEIANQQGLLLVQQVAKEVKENTLLQNDVDNILTKNTILDEELTKIREEIDLLEFQGTKIDKEGKILEEAIVQEKTKVEIALIASKDLLQDAQAAAAGDQASLYSAQSTTEASKKKLIDQQTLIASHDKRTAMFKTAITQAQISNGIDLYDDDGNKTNTNPQLVTGVVGREAYGQLNENSLVGWKALVEASKLLGSFKYTEEDGTIKDLTPTGTVMHENDLLQKQADLIDEQEKLIQRQITGFDDTRDNDLRKAQADIFGVGKAVDDTWPSPPSWYDKPVTFCTPG